MVIASNLVKVAFQKCAAIFLLSAAVFCTELLPRQYRETITIDAARPVRVFDPNETLGAGIDGHDQGEIDKLLSPKNIDEMLTVGFKPITYRLRTELANDAWHWNPVGTWSDATAQQGYWTSDNEPTGDILLSSGYSLPRRGNTIDQADNEGYSRIDDGDPNTFWKSNPYLDKAFTRDDNAKHPQWIVIDLGRETEVNAIRMLWASPFALKYKVQYGRVTDLSDIAQNPPDLWQDLSKGNIKTKTGGDVLSRISEAPIKTRFVRVLMEQSSHTAAEESKDTRDQLGFAIREISIGRIDGDGQFHDEMKHGKSVQVQSVIYVSSTDPWHRSGDIDPDAEHIGFDRLVKSGLTHGQPLLVPVGILYDTPENAAAEIRYLKARGYQIAGVELGEEPDGQYVTPEDYGALYIQWANAIEKVAPDIKIGGPSFQEVKPDTRRRKYVLGNAVWLGRFLGYLRDHHRSTDFSFFSFEWYPVDDVCKPSAPQVAENADLLRADLSNFRRHGLKSVTPLIMSEYGYSAFSSAAEVDIDGALLNAETLAAFLELGGKSAYLYGYEPDRVERDFPCTAGNNMLFVADRAGTIIEQTATYFGAKLAMREWLSPSGGDHQLFRSRSILSEKDRPPSVSSYAVLRPDGKWSLMLINKDPTNESQVDLRFKNADRRSPIPFANGADLYQFSRKNYQWDPTAGRPARNDPPDHERLNGRTKEIHLPPYSLNVVREL